MWRLECVSIVFTWKHLDSGRVDDVFFQSAPKIPGFPCEKCTRGKQFEKWMCVYMYIVYGLAIQRRDWATSKDYLSSCTHAHAIETHIIFSLGGVKPGTAVRTNTKEQLEHTPMKERSAQNDMKLVPKCVLKPFKTESSYSWFPHLEVIQTVSNTRHIILYN